MIIPDVINGAFEGGAGLLVWLNIKQLFKDKITNGIHWAPTLTFNVRGFWNLYYYSYLHQPFSFWGGVNMVTANTIWVGMAVYYNRRARKGAKNATY